MLNSAPERIPKEINSRVINNSPFLGEIGTEDYFTLLWQVLCRRQVEEQSMGHRTVTQCSASLISNGLVVRVRHSLLVDTMCTVLLQFTFLLLVRRSRVQLTE